MLFLVSYTKQKVYIGVICNYLMITNKIDELKEKISLTDKLNFEAESSPVETICIHIRSTLDRLIPIAETKENLDNIGKIFDYVKDNDLNNKIDLTDYQIKASKRMRYLLNEGKISYKGVNKESE